MSAFAGPPSPPLPLAALSSPAQNPPAYFSQGRPFQQFFGSAPLGCYKYGGALGLNLPIVLIRDVSPPLIGATNAAGNSVYIGLSQTLLTYTSAALTRPCNPSDAATNGVETDLPGAVCRITHTWFLGIGGMNDFKAPTVATYGVFYSGYTFPWPAGIIYINYRVNQTARPGTKFLEQQAAGCPYVYSVELPPDPAACASQARPAASRPPYALHLKGGAESCPPPPLLRRQLETRKHNANLIKAPSLPAVVQRPRPR